MVVIIPMIVGVLMMFRRGLFAGSLVLRQQSGFETELAERVLDFFDRGLVVGQRQVQPFAGNGHLHVGNAGQAGKRGLDLCRAAAAVHATDRKGQILRLPVQIAACRNIHDFRS